MTTEDIAGFAALIVGLFVTFTSIAAFFGWCDGGWRKVWDVVKLAGVILLLIAAAFALGGGAAWLIFNLIA